MGYIPTSPSPNTVLASGFSEWTRHLGPGSEEVDPPGHPFLGLAQVPPAPEMCLSLAVSLSSPCQQMPPALWGSERLIRQGLIHVPPGVSHTPGAGLPLLSDPTPPLSWSSPTPPAPMSGGRVADALLGLVPTSTALWVLQA